MKLLISKKTPIEKVNDWARPKRKDHWKAGRSAMELAKAWHRLTVPEELLNLLSGHQRLANLNFIRLVPEKVTSLPEKGEGRNHDLCILSKTPSGNVTISIEAKADEPFGNHTVGEYWSLSMKRRKKGETTKVPERIKKLLTLVGEKGDPTKSQWANVRYQLLTAICGTAIEAKKDSSKLCVFIVHEFKTSKTNKKNLDRNRKDYEIFLRVFLNNKDIVINDKFLYGPVSVNGVKCLVGKVSRKVR